MKKFLLILILFSSSSFADAWLQGKNHVYMEEELNSKPSFFGDVGLSDNFDISGNVGPGQSEIAGRAGLTGDTDAFALGGGVGQGIGYFGRVSVGNSFEVGKTNISKIYAFWEASSTFGSSSVGGWLTIGLNVDRTTLYFQQGFGYYSDRVSFMTPTGSVNVGVGYDVGLVNLLLQAKF